MKQKIILSLNPNGKRLYLSFILYLLLLISTIAYSQNQEWISAYSNNKYNTLASVSPDNTGNVFISGWGQRYLPDTARQYPLAIKFDSKGNFKWLRTYPVWGVARSHTLDNNGNLYLLTSYEQYDVGIIKYNTLGDTVWSRIFTAETPTKIISDKGKFIYASAKKRDPVTFGFDYYTIKLDTAGNLIWDMRVDSIHNSSEQPYDMTIDNSGNIYVTGYSAQGTDRSFTVKLDSSGNLVWESLHQSGDFDCPSFSIALDNSGNVYVAGYAFIVGPGDPLRYKIIKYSPSGNLIWESLPRVGLATRVLVDNTSNSYLSGDAGVVKINSNGDLTRYDSSYGTSILLDNNDNLYQFNFVFDSVISKVDRLNTIKKDSSGNLLWLKFIQLPQNYSFGNGDFSIDNNSVYIAITKSLNPGNDSILVIKYSQKLISIEPISSIIPKEFKLFQNYPNPFNPVTYFKFHIPKSANIDIKIFDLLGREVSSVLNENLKPGEYKVSFNAVNLASGIYFYTMYADNKLIDTKKMMLVK